MGGCRVTIDTSRCTGIGLCEATAPGLFELGEDGLAHLLVSTADASRRHELEEAALNCPTQAIAVSAAG